MLKQDFDYKDFIPDADKGNVMWSSAHIIFIILAVLTIILLCYFLRNVRKDSVDKYIKTIAIIIPISMPGMLGILIPHGQTPRISPSNSMSKMALKRCPTYCFIVGIRFRKLFSLKA